MSRRRLHGLHNVAMLLSTELIHAERAGPEVDRAAAMLRTGKLVAFATETVYGLGALASDSKAVQRIFSAKGRPGTDPLIVHGAGLDQLEPVVSGWSPESLALAAEFWPGPLTMVLERTDHVASAVSAGGPSVAVRVPAHPVALELLRSTGSPVAAPSANRFGRISPTSAEHVREELTGLIDAILDSGPTPLGIESTVVDLTGEMPRVLRPGGVTIEDLRAVVGDVDFVDRAATPEQATAASPGQFLRHYAPATPLVLVEGDALCAELAAQLDRRGVDVAVVGLPGDERGAARDLYKVLRKLDSADNRLLLVAARPPTGLGRAVNDRMFRAAHGRVVVDRSESTLGRLENLGRPVEADRP